MKYPQPLHVGDRVRTIVPLVDLPAGVHGVVRAIFPLGDYYDVYFAEGIGLRIVHRRKLEPLRPTQESGMASSA